MQKNVATPHVTCPVPHGGGGDKVVDVGSLLGMSGLGGGHNHLPSAHTSLLLLLLLPLPELEKGGWGRRRSTEERKPVG